MGDMTNVSYVSTTPFGNRNCRGHHCIAACSVAPLARLPDVEGDK